MVIFGSVVCVIEGRDSDSVAAAGITLLGTFAHTYVHKPFSPSPFPLPDILIDPPTHTWPLRGRGERGTKNLRVHGMGWVTSDC